MRALENLAVQHVELDGYALDKDGQDKLLALLSAGASTDCARPLLDHALQLGARYVVVEAPYTDQDYSADFVSFYASAFKTYPRTTKRVHFFADDVSELLAYPFAQQAEAFDNGPDYLGFSVVRPLAQGPVGRTILRFPKFEGLIVRRAARASSKAHLLAVELQVEGAPFIQQDTRVGACAQAAIWMASRPLSERHRQIGWHSVSQITSFATTPTDPELSRALPHGSQGLSPLHIIRALGAMGHQPYSAVFEQTTAGNEEEKLETDNVQQFDADSECTGDGQGPDLGAQASVMRYLDSGLPVILGLTDPEKAHEGHAVTAVGYAEVEGGAVNVSPGYDAFVRAFIVHDDQRGPYRLMPLCAEDIAELPTDRLMRFGDKIVTAQNYVSHIFVPLSTRVFLAADKADVLAGDFLEQQILRLATGELNPVLGRLDASETNELQRFCNAWDEGKIVRRTYLTTAGGYRRHCAQTELPDAIKQLAITRKLPHFIWVCELFYSDSAAADGKPREVIGHIVMNATSSTDLDGDLLFAQLPCLVIQRDVDPPPTYAADYLEKGAVIAGCKPYAQRVRR